MKIAKLTTYRVPPRWMLLKIETDEGAVPDRAGPGAHQPRPAVAEQGRVGGQLAHHRLRADQQIDDGDDVGIGEHGRIGKQAGKRQRDVVTVRAAVFVRMLGQAGRKQRRDTGAYAIEQGSSIRQVGYWVWRLPVRVVPPAWLADLMRAL